MTFGTFENPPPQLWAVQSRYHTMLFWSRADAVSEVVRRKIQAADAGETVALRVFTCKCDWQTMTADGLGLPADLPGVKSRQPAVTTATVEILPAPASLLPKIRR